MAQSAATRRRFRPGDVLISTSDDDSDAYIIERGEVGVWRETDAGRTLIARLGEGQMVGELSLIDGEGRTATVTASIALAVRSPSKSFTPPASRVAVAGLRCMPRAPSRPVRRFWSSDR